MATKTVKQDFIKSGEELRKRELGKNFNSEFTAREQPSSQASGRAGYAKPELQSWTDEELEAHIDKLNISIDGERTRDAMIEAIASNGQRA